MRKKIAEYLHSEEKNMFKLLEALVLQPSSSRSKKGVDAVGALVVESLQSSGMSLEIDRQSEVGDHLLFRSSACHKSQPSILLFGHMDTVFPIDSPFNWYKDDGEKIFGPGVIDMKGGLVCAVYAIKALAFCGLLEKIPITFLCNSDEEIGSSTSYELINAEAKKSLLALGFECGGLQGEVVTGRKGRLGYKLVVTGKAGHAAFAGADKASAILEMANKIIALEKLNDLDRKIVVNIGTVQGGIGPNTVADRAEAEIDTRFLSVADASDTSERIVRIVTQCSVLGTKTELIKTGERLPMEQTPQNSALFKIIQNEAQLLAIPCLEEMRSGVSDANTIAQNSIPVVDGLGPIGDCDHSDREYMVRASLPARVRLAACSIVSCWGTISDFDKAGESS
ncbi:MAG: M20 family metallopeptidase [Proteobacteria bacterium]|nr:M20 family metallopeptidase [Pseudomonadota bacterium]